MSPSRANAAAAGLLRNFFPSVDARAGYAYNRGREYFVTQAAPAFVTTTNRSADYTLTADLNLFNGLADLAGYRSGRDRHTAADPHAHARPAANRL